MKQGVAVIANNSELATVAHPQGRMIHAVLCLRHVLLNLS